MISRVNNKLKSISLIVAAAILVSVFPQVGVNAETKTQAQQQKTTEQGSTSTSSSRENTYSAYLNKYKNVPAAEKSIVLDAKDSKLSSQNASMKSDVAGIKNVVALDENGTVTWEINVAATAMYTIDLNYYALPGRGRDIQLGLKLDGAIPYSNAEDFSFKRIWKDASKMKQDYQGNDLTAEQVEVTKWQNTKFHDYTSYVSDPFQICLTAGKHTIALNDIQEPVAIKSLELGLKETIPTYSEVEKQYESKGYSKTGNDIVIQQAEVTTAKSDQTLSPTYDRASPATEDENNKTNDAFHIKRNTIGQSNWSNTGMWVSYNIEVPNDGLYKLSLKYRQNYQSGMATCRDIYVDGNIPFKEMQSIDFNYDMSWNMKTISDAAGQPCLLYLTKGTHEIKIVSTLGKWSEVLQNLDELNYELNNLYTKIVMITGPNPDVYRDYYLDKNIPGLMDTLQKASKSLISNADLFDKVNGSRSSQSELLRRNSVLLNSFIKDPTNIPAGLTTYRSNISALSDWLNEVKKQPLELDYIALSSKNKQVPDANANIFERAKFSVLKFVASFIKDYNSMGPTSKNAITVWVGDGRDQTQILKNLIEDKFTPQTGIKVNLNLVQGGLIEGTLAGTGPDVALNVARGQPVNLACRGALVDLSKFSTYNDVTKRFSSNALVPYQYKDGTYAIPNTQTYFMMFYRTDIFKKLNIQPPKSWDDFYSIIPVLQRNNLNVALPYSTFTAQGTVDGGLGAKDMFPTLLLENGGQFYNSSKTASALNSAVAYKAFKMWTDFYNVYGAPLTFDFNSRFRTGEYPIGIQPYSAYNTFSVAAPEIRGLWAMTLVPGIKQADGTINRTCGASGSANVMFSKAKNKEACWKFLDWFSSTEIQAKYGNDIENLLGPAARYTSANIEAFDLLPWSKSDLKNLEEQRSYIQEVPEVPGSYYVSRCLDNAFRSVVNNGKVPREQFEQQYSVINDEITRIQKEIGMQ